MPGTRRRQPYEKVNFQQEVYLQVSIFLWTLFLMIILLAAFFFQMPVAASAVINAVLLSSTLVLRIKFKDFYKFRDRGQRTWCATCALYASLCLTGGCIYVYNQSAEMTWDYALVFLFGFLFFTYMAYRSLSPTMVVGNKRTSIR